MRTEKKIPAQFSTDISVMFAFLREENFAVIGAYMNKTQMCHKNVHVYTG
jgi:hypothetical protein